ncbi:hypothetical protein Dimus_000861, partial [Dionaea muscipula]
DLVIGPVETRAELPPLARDPTGITSPSTSIPIITELSREPSPATPLTDDAIHEHINLAVKCMLKKMDERSEAKLTKQMGLVTKDVDTLIIAIQEKIPKSITANTDYIEKNIDEAKEDSKTEFGDGNKAEDD